MYTFSINGNSEKMWKWNIYNPKVIFCLFKVRLPRMIIVLSFPPAIHVRKSDLYFSAFQRTLALRRPSRRRNTVITASLLFRSVGGCWTLWSRDVATESNTPPFSPRVIGKKKQTKQTKQDNLNSIFIALERRWIFFPYFRKPLSLILSTYSPLHVNFIDKRLWKVRAKYDKWQNEILHFKNAVFASIFSPFV